jgi:hypothetical protein
MAGFSTKTFSKCDEYMTPLSAWEAIRQYIPTGKVIWEPFYGDGTSGANLRSLGFTVHHEDQDFFENNHGDIVVSNPPYTIKKDVIKRLIELDKPFILLMPVATMATAYVRELLKDSLQIIVPRRRIQYQKLIDGKVQTEGKCNFDCYYFCHKMNLPRDIVILDS